MTNEIAVRPGSAKPFAFQVLGAFQLTVGGQSRELGPEQEQRMLVAMLGARGARVPHGRLMEAVWDDQPEGALDALYHLAHNLRRRLQAAGLPNVLTGINGTYQLDIPADWVDVHRFHTLVDQARAAAGGGDPHAVGLLEEALRLHRGEPLAGMRGRWVSNYRHSLAEERRAVELTLYEAAIRRGESRERLPGLQALFRERPQDEWVAWLLMHALYRAGRQSDALAVRQEVAGHLKTMSMASPKALGDLCGRILRQDDDLLRPEAVRFPADTVGERVRPLGFPGTRTISSRDQEEGDTVGTVTGGGETRDERTIALGRLKEDEPGTDGQPSGSPDADPEPVASPDPRPQTSVVINGSVNASWGGVVGTQNNYGGSR